MRNDEMYIPSVLDFAYEIIAIHEKNEVLKMELEHYKKMYEIVEDSCKSMHQNNVDTISMTLTALVDPESSLNKASN